MTFSDEVWESTAVLRKAIDDLPFLAGLADGTLPREVFTSYLAQDAHYLADYGRVLALAAAQADTADDLLLWAGAPAPPWPSSASCTSATSATSGRGSGRPPARRTARTCSH